MKCLKTLASEIPHIPTVLFFLTHLPQFKKEEFSLIPSLSWTYTFVFLFLLEFCYSLNFLLLPGATFSSNTWKRSFHSSLRNTSGGRQTGQLCSVVRRRHFLSNWVIWQDNYKFLSAGNQFVYTPLPYFTLSVKSLLSGLKKKFPLEIMSLKREYRKSCSKIRRIKSYFFKMHRHKYLENLTVQCNKSDQNYMKHDNKRGEGGYTMLRIYLMIAKREEVWCENGWIMVDKDDYTEHVKQHLVGRGEVFWANWPKCIRGLTKKKEMAETK